MNVDAVLSIISLAAISISVGLVVVLHYVEPEFDPSWRMLSEYSLGKAGLLMRLAFIAGSAGVVACALSLAPVTLAGSIALVVVALGPLGAAFVDTDPITTPRPEVSARSKVHSALGSVYILGFPIAATIAGVTSGNAVLAWTCALPWLGLVWFMAATLRRPAPNGVGGPDIKIGWPNRFSMLLYFAWIAIVAFSLLF